MLNAAPSAVSLCRKETTVDPSTTSTLATNNKSVFKDSYGTFMPTLSPVANFGPQCPVTRDEPSERLPGPPYSNPCRGNLTNIQLIRRNLELVAGTEPSLLSNSNPHPAPLLDLPKPLTRSSLAIHPQGVALRVPSAIAPSETHLVGELS